MHIIDAHTVAALGPIRDQPLLYRSLMFLGSFVRTWSSGLLQSGLLSCAPTPASCVVDYLCCSCGKRPQVTATAFTCEVFPVSVCTQRKQFLNSCILSLCTKPCVYACLLNDTFHLMSFNSYRLVLT